MIKHGLLYLLAKLLTGTVGFLSIFIYTRLLYPDEYGRYAMILIYVSVGSAVLYQWFRLGLIRYVPKCRTGLEQYRTLLRTVGICYAAVFLLSALIGLALLCAGIPFAELSAAMLQLWTMAWFELSQALQRSNLQPVRFGIMGGVKSLLSLSISILFIKAGWGEIGLLLGIAVGNAAANVLFLKEWKPALYGRYDRALAMQLLRYGLPLIISGSMTYIMQSIDRVMIGWLKGDMDAGIYAVGYDFAFQTVGMLMMVVNLSALPHVIRKLEQEGAGEAREQMNNNLRLLLLVSVPVVIGISTISFNLSHVIFGAQYAAALHTILPFIAMMMFIQGIKLYYTDLSYQLGGTTYWQVVPVAVGIASNLVLHSIFIPMYGLMGAAVSSLVSCALSLASNLFFTQRVFRLPYSYQSISRIVLAGLIMGVLLMPLVSLHGILGLIVQISAGAMIYAGALIAMNEFGLRTKVRSKLRLRA